MNELTTETKIYSITILTNIYKWYIISMFML